MALSSLDGPFSLPKFCFHGAVPVFRRDKEFCHECRFCCTLSVCTVGDKHIFKDSNMKKTNEVKTEKSQTILAKTGFLEDFEMLESHDYRCLKPKEWLRPETWPHYYMPEFRAAKNKDELEKVEEVPFDKNFLNLEDPKVLKLMTDPVNGPKLWKKTYGMDFVHFLHMMLKDDQIFYDLHKLYQDCLEAEYGKFALDCKERKGFFKCCIQV